MTTKIYKIPYTDASKKPISVPRRIFIDDIVDITLIGKRTLEYGEAFNENLLHLLEHFACNSDPEDLAKPDKSLKLSHLLENPIDGQLWFSKNTGCLFVYRDNGWKEFNSYGSVRGNSGFVFDGERVPFPLDIYGNEFSISDCAISVAPISIPVNVEAFRCSVNSSGVVTCKYTPVGGTELSGHAAFVIVGRTAATLIV